MVFNSIQQLKAKDRLNKKRRLKDMERESELDDRKNHKLIFNGDDFYLRRKRR